MMRYIKVLMIAAMSVLLLAACGDDETSKVTDGPSDLELETLNETGFPIVDEEITLDFFAAQTPQTNDDWNDVLVFNKYEDMTNINIEWEMTPIDTISEKKNLLLGSGSDSLPDAFHTVGMSDSDLMKYGQQGVFVKLNDLLEEYAPNLTKIFEENPEIEKAVTMADGNIYSFPAIEEPEFLSMRMPAKPYINEEWLNELGMDMPETTDEFYNYLKAVKEEDPGNNGGIPYGAPHIEDLMSWLKGAFGIANKGFQNRYYDLDPNGDSMRFYPTSDEYKELLQYVNKLYSEGLIQENIFSIEMDQYLANASDGLYGSTNWYSPVDIFGKEAGGKFTGAPALEGPYGDKTYISVKHPVVQKGVFTITSENDYPAATVRWMDHFYSDEGAKLFFMGVEGETYEVNEDGEVDFMDHIRNSDEGLTFEQEAAKYLTWPGGGAPGIFKEEYFKGAESSDQELEAASKLEPNAIEDPLPAFSYTDDELKKLNSFGRDIEKYVDEMQDKFIVGEKSFDEWDQYVEELEKMGLEDYMDVQESAYERYQNN